jgi:hypothetical protein
MASSFDWQECGPFELRNVAHEISAIVRLRILCRIPLANVLRRRMHNTSSHREHRIFCKLWEVSAEIQPDEYLVATVQFADDFPSTE